MTESWGDKINNAISDFNSAGLDRKIEERYRKETAGNGEFLTLRPGDRLVVGRNPRSQIRQTETGKTNTRFVALSDTGEVGGGLVGVQNENLSRRALFLGINPQGRFIVERQGNNEVNFRYLGSDGKWVETPMQPGKPIDVTEMSVHWTVDIVLPRKQEIDRSQNIHGAPEKDIIRFTDGGGGNRSGITREVMARIDVNPHLKAAIEPKK